QDFGPTRGLASGGMHLPALMSGFAASVRSLGCDVASALTRRSFPLRTGSSSTTFLGTTLLGCTRCYPMRGPGFLQPISTRPHGWRTWPRFVRPVAGLGCMRLLSDLAPGRAPTHG